MDFYNLRNNIQLTLVESLPLALFVVQFAEENLTETKEFLLASSPLSSLDILAFVNILMITRITLFRATFPTLGI